MTIASQLIRPMTAADPEPAADLLRRGDFGDRLGFFQWAIGRPTIRAFVAEDDGRIVGTLVAAWDGWRGNMYRLAVLPELRRNGIGRALVDAGHEHLRDLGARRVTALVGHEEDAAVALWEATGYERDESLVRFVRNL